MGTVATLQSRHDVQTSIELDERDLPTLVRSGAVDAFIVATEDGFSPLGANRGFLSSDLGIPEEQIGNLAKWNFSENPKVSLVALRSRRPSSCLRGVVLAASENAECYKRYATPRYGRPYRDFYYNVTYEAISYVCENWRARRIAISHLSGSGNFHEDVATCNAEALAHYCDANDNANIQSFIFVGCCISLEHMAGIRRLNAEGSGRHLPITTTLEHRKEYDILHLDLNREVPATHRSDCA